MWFTMRFVTDLCTQRRTGTNAWALLGAEKEAWGWYITVRRGASSQGKEKRRHATSRMTDSIRCKSKKSKEMGYFRPVNSDSGRCDPGGRVHPLPAPRSAAKRPIYNSSDAIDDPDDG